MQQCNNSMNKILSVRKTIKIAENIRKQGKSIVLAGGCFDIIHIGHIKFLESAKRHGDVLFVLLEGDKTVHLKKGKNRPINAQKVRAIVLSALNVVDYVILLPPLYTNSHYDAIIGDIKPDVIATTKGDPNRIHKKRQAQLVNGRVIDVVKKISGKSTTRVAQLLSEEL